MNDQIESTLAVRQKTHGDFPDVAEKAQTLKTVMFARRTRCSLAQREALEMIAVKIARIVCGSPDCEDHWLDIEGYARLGRGWSGEGER